MIPTVIYEDNDFLVIDKPHGLPSAPLSSTDFNNAFSLIAKKNPEVLRICGKKSIEGGLVHRIDTDTKGLVLIARTQTAYDNFLQQQVDGTFIKHYTAICIPAKDFLTPNLPQVITSKFRPFGEGRKMVQPVFENSGKAALKKASPKSYSTEIYSIEKEKSVLKVKCKIKEGYRHQVRCHLAYRGLPIINDSLYGIQVDNQPMQFFATMLEFYHPITGDKISIR